MKLVINKLYDINEAITIILNKQIEKLHFRREKNRAEIIFMLHCIEFENLHNDQLHFITKCNDKAELNNLKPIYSLN